VYIDLVSNLLFRLGISLIGPVCSIVYIGLVDFLPRKMLAGLPEKARRVQMFAEMAPDAAPMMGFRVGTVPKTYRIHHKISHTMPRGEQPSEEEEH
jgi:hypothetical protein